MLLPVYASLNWAGQRWLDSRLLSACRAGSLGGRHGLAAPGNVLVFYPEQRWLDRQNIISAFWDGEIGRATCKPRVHVSTLGVREL